MVKLTFPQKECMHGPEPGLSDTRVLPLHARVMTVKSLNRIQKATGEFNQFPKDRENKRQENSVGKDMRQLGRAATHTLAAEFISSTFCECLK